MSRTLVDRLMDRVEFAVRPLAEITQQLGAKAMASGGPTAVQIRDILNGTWLGHPLHPMLTDLPIGAWTAAWLLDLADRGRGEGMGKGADMLIAVGCAGGLAAALSGGADLLDRQGRERDQGELHAVVNSAGLMLFLTSLVARRRGRRAKGMALSMAGLSLATAGAFLGGDLVFRFGVQVNRNAFTAGPGKWREVAEDSEVSEGELVTKQVGPTKILLTRLGGEVFATGAVCPHLGGPLGENPLKDGRISCPWHGSTFDVRSGGLVHGPAAVGVPVFETRVVEGKLEIKRQG